MSMIHEGPEVQAAMILAAAVLLASGRYTTEDAADEVRALRAVLRCAPLAPGVGDADRPF